MEINGRIVDMRSTAARMYQDSKGCNALSENCLVKEVKTSYEMPVLTESEFKKIVGKDGTEYFIPIDVRKEDLMLLTGALSLGVVVFANDRAIMDFVQDHKVPEAQPLVDFGNFAGRGGIPYIAAGSYFIGVVMKDNKMKQIGLFTVGAGLATQAVTELFKNAFGRTRPNETTDPYEFGGEGKSFFSGHTSAAFSVATVIAEVYKDKPLVPYLAYGAAAVTAYARMHDQKHWATDVLAGAVAGTLVTKIFMRAFESDDSRIPSGLLVIPEYGRDLKGNPRYGVQIQWKPAQKKGPSKCTQMGLTGEALVHACFEENLNN
jgi:membrane-associated phospholipid phosphatase